MRNGITLDFDTADKITLLVMQDQLKGLRMELAEFQDRKKRFNLEDVVNTAKIIAALELLIPYYGGTP
jgi:hypothetical protein